MRSCTHARLTGAPLRALSTAQSCESGIPLDYLSGLDECYQNLLRNMRASSTVLRLPWDSFGTTDQVVEALRTMAEPPADQGWERADELLALCVSCEH